MVEGMIGHLPICTSRRGAAQPEGSANQGSAMQVHIKQKGFGWAWVGVFTLAVIGVSAIVYGEEHEGDFNKRKGER